MARRHSNICVDLCPISRAAALVLDGARPSRFGEYTNLGLHYEHAVPLAVLFDLIRQVVTDGDAIKELIESQYHTVWVTKAENEAIKFAGLISRMPDGWTSSDSWLARYEAAGIEL
ncbi:hypothetical protein Q4518_13220 [Shimia thalassica]|nr:hypothetical protein [Shimia thalassica]